MAKNPFFEQSAANPFLEAEPEKEGAFARAGRIARDKDGGLLAAAGSLIEAALPDSRAGRDTTVAALKSAVGVPQGAIGLIDIASGGRFGRALEQAGIDPNAAQRALDELYSPETQAAKREVQAAEGFTDTAGAMLRNPSTILTGIGESIAPMFAGGLVGRGAVALAPRLSPAAGAAIGEGALMAGQSASQIRGQTEDGLLTPTQSALAAGTGVVGGLVGRAGGALSNRVGIGDVDTAIVQGGLAEAAKRPGFLARTALGAGIEGGVEEMPQSVVEQAAQNVALGKPWDEGLGSAAAQGLVVGAPFGAVGANLSRPTAPQAPAPAADPLDAQAARMTAATDAYLNDRPGADTIASIVSKPTVDEAIDALGAESPSMEQILADKRARAAQRVAQELGFAGQVDARSPEQIMADAAARREQATLAAQQELGLSPSATAAQDVRTADQIVADFEARRQAAIEQVQGAPAAQEGRTEQDFAARRREAALAAISDMGESLPRFRYTPALQGNKQEVASTEPDLVGTYVQQMRETNTPAARAFVQLYESGRITDQDVSDTIARQNPQLQAPAQPAIPSNATPLQAEGIQIEQMRRRASPTLDLKQPEQAVAERAQAQRAEGDATPELTQQRLEAAAAQGRQQDPMTPVQVGQYIDALRLENTPQARALVQEYEAGRVTDQDVADAVNAQRRYQLGGVDLAQNRIETAATQGAQQAPGLQVERSGARAPNAALAEAVQMYGDMPLTARDMTVEGASERLSRAAAQARQTPESLIQVGDTTQTSRVPFRGRNEAIRTSNEGLDAAAAGRGGERMTAPRPTLIGGKPPGSYTDQQLKDLVGNDLVPAITRRGAETELAVRALQQRAQAPAAPAAPGTTSPGGIILASAKRSPQDVLSSVARSRESKVGRPVQMTVVDTNTLPAQRGTGAGALSRQAHTIINNVSRVFGKKLVVFESDDATAPDGFYSRDDADTIYLNRNSETPHLVVFGHELLHSLRKDNEAGYQALVKTIKLKEGADISETPGIRGDIEEFTADLMGNQFRDNEFWVATFRDIIASKGEQQGRQVVTRLAAAAVRAVNGLMKALGRAPGYNTDEMVANLGEVKTALRSALSTYAKDRYGAAVAMERERVAAAPAPAPAAAAAPATTVAPTATEDAQASEKRVEGPFKPARTMSELEDVLASEKRGEGELRTKLNKDGSLTVYGDPDQVRAMLPEGIVGRNVQGGVSFTASQAPRVRAAVEGRRVAYSRQGEVTEKLPVRDGKYIGSPEKYNTPAKISTLRRNLRQLTMEGQAGRYWYENSSREVLAMVGGNVQEARKFVALLSIYSPQAKVDANSTFALRAWAQYKAGQPISVKTGVQDRKATAALQDVDAFWSGEKTGNFFFNLLREIDPSTAGKQGATIDMWMMRAAEYSSDAPTSTQYAFMENETNRIAREMGWEPQQVQAAIWVAMKARMENAGVKKRTEASSEKKGWIRYDYPIKNGRPTKTRVILDAQKHRDNWLKHAFQHDPTKSDTQGAKFDFSDGLRRHIGQLSWEARPGRTTGVLPGVNDAPYEQQVEFQQAVQKALLDDDGVDLLAYKLGLLVDGPDILAPGVWQGEIAAGMQKQVGMAPAKGEEGQTRIDPAQKKTLEVYASVLGLLLRQEGVGYHRPFYKNNKSEENAVNLDIGRTFTPAEAQALWSAMDQRMRAAGVPNWENDAGLVSSPDGMRVINYGALADNFKFRAMVASAAETLPVGEVSLQSFSTDGNLVTNNWKENPNGEGYRSRISEAYGSYLLDWTRDVLAPRVQSVFDEFSSKYGWGNAGNVQDLFQRPAAPAPFTRARSLTQRQAGDTGPADVVASEKRPLPRGYVGPETAEERQVLNEMDAVRTASGAAWDAATGRVADELARRMNDTDLPPETVRKMARQMVYSFTGAGGRYDQATHPFFAEVRRLNEQYMGLQERARQLLDERLGPPEFEGMQQLDQFDRPQTRTEEFKTWATWDWLNNKPGTRYTKVVDTEGRPLIALHGTGSDIVAFQPAQTLSRRIADNNWLGELGTWFAAPSPNDSYEVGGAEGTAEVFAEMRGQESGGVIYPVFLSINNPAEFEGYEELVDARDRAGGGAAFRKTLVDKGHDGLVVRDSTTDGNQFRDDWVAFFPQQVKSAIGNTGAFDPINPDIRYSDKRSPLGFYSALASGLDGTKTGAAPAQGWKDAIKGLVNKGTAKADEVEWSGVNDWLDLQQGKVTKDQVSEYLKQGGVRVEETQMGGPRGLPAILSDYFENTTVRQPTTTEGWIEEAARQERKARSFQAQGRTDTAKRLFELAEAMNEYAEGGETGALATKYRKYTLPGGSNYREVLLTLPSKMSTKEEIAKALYGKPFNDLTVNEASRVLNELGSPTDGKTYRSTHWDQPNVLAHIRLNDRTDADGNKVLFVEEIQSDWGQEGKKKGIVQSYKPEDVQPVSAVEAGFMTRADEELFWFFKTPDNIFQIQKSKYPNREDARDYIVREKKINGNGVPNAPFINKTEGWLNLALKRVMVMAVEGGYDKVAFVNGEQSAERFSLDKQIDSVSWRPAGADRATITISPKSGAAMIGIVDTNTGVFPRFESGVFGGESLESVLGKEIAERVLASPEGSLAGDGLKVEAKGMRAFYDTIVPTALKKLLPKVGGGQMGAVSINTAQDLSDTPDDLVVRINPTSDGRFRVGVGAGEARRAETFSTREQAQSWADEQVAAARSGRVSPQPGFDITPAMREKVSEGLPLFSEKRNIFNQPVAPSWAAAPDTKLDQFIYKVQDKQIDLKRIIDTIKEVTGQISDRWNAYLAEELYHGRTAKQTKDFLQDEMKPLVDAMTANRVTMPELEEYLHNRHAEERNRQIATINPNLPDAGSGIATADARRYLAGLPANQRQRYEALARQVDAINKKTRQLLVSSGLEKQDTIDAWERTYPTYMPLFREDADYDGSQSQSGSGMGFSVRGPSSKRATGSADREVVDILANVALMRERTITRAEKARVGRALYGLAVQNPNPGFWLAIDPKTPKDIPGAVNTLISMGMTAQDARGLMQQPTVPYVDPRTGLVTYRVNPLLRNADHVMSVRVDGEDKMLVFNPRDERAQRMVTSLKNLDAQQLGGALSAAAFVSRWFAQVNTQYNPVFGAINLIRDVGGAAFNLTTTDIADRKAQVMAGVGPALVGIYQDLRKNRTGQRSQGQWAQLWEEFQREGGQTGFRDMFSRSDERAVALQRMLDPSSWAESPLGKFFTANGTLKAPMEVVRKGAAPVFNWLSDYNETLENAVRLSAYKAAKDKGLSNAKAASIAKNLTVNFNRKGQVGVQLGALYAFFNASVQGTARLAETLGSGRDPNASAYSPNRYMGKTGQRIIAGGLLLGVMQAVALAMAGFDEDEPPEFIKERNLVIPLDWVDNLGGPDLDGKFLTIPMPLGLNVIPNTGRVLTEWWMSGFKDTPKRVASITGSFLEMFNPIGNAGWSVQTIAPTFADPLVALSENRDWTGKPIAKEDRSGTDPTPGYTRAKDTASIISKGIAYALNAVSGGTDYKPGVVSPTPDQIDYLIGQVTGGVGREVLKVSQAVESGVTGEDLPTYKIPVAGRFYGDIKELSAVSSRYYDNLTRMNQHENEIKGRAADRVPIGDYFEDNPEARLVSLSNRIEREVSDLRRRKRELIKREASKESIKMVEEAIRRRMQSLNDAIERAQERAPAAAQ
jgi:hypothetical protein